MSRMKRMKHHRFLAKGRTCDGGGISAGNTNILLLPAWPKDRDVDFKLHAPGRTTVECRAEGGKVVTPVVTPESRRKDVELCPPFTMAP